MSMPDSSSIAGLMTCARIPTSRGEFQLCLYLGSPDGKEHLAIVNGNVAEKESVLVRVHSECFTGDVLGSLRCDCGPQLNAALDLIADAGEGVVLYLRQEGRGIGLEHKLQAYNLQDQGYDTVDANVLLGHEPDERDYTVAATMLRLLRVRSVRLLTNNPGKVSSLERLGIPVVERIPLEVGLGPENAVYLRTKALRMNHVLSAHPPAVLLDPRLPLSPTPPEPNRPAVTLSYAQSLDGCIAAVPGQSLPLSGAESMLLTHRLRAAHDAILVGIGTVLADDPRLTVRLVEGQSPRPVIVDSRLRFPPDARLLEATGVRPLIATTEQADREREALLEAAGATVLRLPASTDGRVDLAALLQRLATLGVSSVMVEGGARIIASFLAQRLVDRIVVTVVPRLVGGVHPLGTADGDVHYPSLRNVHYQRAGDDMVVWGEPDWDAA